MSDYWPDTYQFIRISSDQDKEIVTKLFAVWTGGYLDGASWKINSGITKIVKEDGMYYVHGCSGSVYAIPIEQPPMTSYGASVLNDIDKQAKGANINIELISSEEAFKEFGE